MASDLLRACLVLCLLLVRRPRPGVAGVHGLLAYFGEKVFDYGNGVGIATLYTARGVASFAGPFAAFWLVGTGDVGLRRSIRGAFALVATCYCAFALSPMAACGLVALLPLAFWVAQRRAFQLAEGPWRR